MENLENIKEALRNVLGKVEIISPLALILEYGSLKKKEGPSMDQVSYGEIENLLRGSSKEIIIETLIWAAQWRLMLPSWRRDFRSLCWADRMIISTKRETKYEVLRVVQCLVRGAAQTGVWNPEEAAKEVFKAITHLDSALAVQIVRMIVKRAQKDFREEVEGEFPYYFIHTGGLKQIFDQVGVGNRKDSDLWVAELKATDIMTPAIPASSVFAIRGENIGFEVNPSLFVKMSEPS